MIINKFRTITMKSGTKRAAKGSVTPQHHAGAEEKTMKLRLIASVNGARVGRYQCLCCASSDKTSSKRIKYSLRIRLRMGGGLNGSEKSPATTL